MKGKESGFQRFIDLFPTFNGKPVRDIAEQLGLSEQTVRYYATLAQSEVSISNGIFHILPENEQKSSETTDDPSKFCGLPECMEGQPAPKIHRNKKGEWIIRGKAFSRGFTLFSEGEDV